MLEHCKNAKERWGGVNDLIDKWLHERQDLLVLYCDLSTNIEDGLFEVAANQLRTLCQLLVDYVSAGHFEIYDQLVKEGRAFNDTEGLQEASKLFSIIDLSTEYALDFNDKYLETDDLRSLSNDLSTLGEKLATRFESEDRVIHVLHDAHKATHPKA